MIPISMLHVVRARIAQVRFPAGAERLRRAGYADGERRPRKERYWANR